MDAKEHLTALLRKIIPVPDADELVTAIENFIGVTSGRQRFTPAPAEEHVEEEEPAPDLHAKKPHARGKK